MIKLLPLSVAALALLLVVAPVAECQASWQWTVRGYATRADASAAYAATSAIAQVVETNDTRVTTFGTPTPYVVFKYELTDIWCCAPEHFVYAMPVSAPWDEQAIPLFLAWRSSHMSASIGIQSVPIAGKAIVWRVE